VDIYILVVVVVHVINFCIAGCLRDLLMRLSQVGWGPTNYLLMILFSSLNYNVVRLQQIFGC
jgi:hypothetical protein